MSMAVFVSLCQVRLVEAFLANSTSLQTSSDFDLRVLSKSALF